MIRLQRKTIRTRDHLSPVWDMDTGLELIYANIRNLLAFNKSSLYREDHWELIFEIPHPKREGESLRLYSQMSRNLDVTCLKMECPSSASPHDAFLLALDLSRRKEWDPVFQVAISNPPPPTH